MKKKKHQKQARTNSLRIISGQWRSRKLAFPDAPGLRPTPDRIRETLFNWLQGKVVNANGLDLFAGSGALGLEALSRGAGSVVFVEKNKAVATQLISNLTLLNSVPNVIQADALDYLSAPTKPPPFDLIFLDPPYRQGLIEKSLALINEKEWLKPEGLIYLEHESEEHFDWSEYNLMVLKEARAGQVNCYLVAKIVNK